MSDSEVYVRDTDAPVAAADVDKTSIHYVTLGLMRMQEALGELARQTENRGNPVDEYMTAPITGTSNASAVTFLPTYDFMPEKIEYAIVVGPPSAQVTLTLGDRSWPLTIPASGILSIGPMALILGRNDSRTLTATPGSPVTPAVPASTISAQNTNPYPVAVTISGGTFTGVYVNSVEVGNGPGTYTVPPYGAIGVTYTVPPTWSWANANAGQIAGNYSLELMGIADKRFRI